MESESPSSWCGYGSSLHVVEKTEASERNCSFALKNGCAKIKIVSQHSVCYFFTTNATTL